MLRRRRPIFNALSLTAASALFVASGLAGYTLSRHDRFVAGTAWTDGVLWWQVGLGLALLGPAAYFWREGLHALARDRAA